MNEVYKAVKRVVERCREANPYHMHIPVDGAMAMKWLLEELEEVQRAS